MNEGMRYLHILMRLFRRWNQAPCRSAVSPWNSDGSTGRRDGCRIEETRSWRMRRFGYV